MREAVAAGRTPLSTVAPLLGALAAAAFLRYTGVGDIAWRVGFKSVYHFSRRVKEQTGASPSEIRRRRWDASRAAPPAPRRSASSPPAR